MRGLRREGGLRWYFGFFLASGFRSLVYEVVWLRLAMAAFGVTTNTGTARRDADA